MRSARGVTVAELTAEDVDVLSELLKLPPFPLSLEPAPSGARFDEHKLQLERVLDRLREQGLVHGTAVRDDLADALGLLACGEIVIDGCLLIDRPLDVVGVVQDDQAAVGIQSDETVQLCTVPGRYLVDMIVSLLPNVSRLPGSSLTFPHDVFIRALSAFVKSGDGGELDRILVEGGISSADAYFLASMARADGLIAQFSVSIRNPITETYRNRSTWIWYATTAGGVLLSHADKEHPVWTTLTPADPARVGRHLSDAVYTLKYGQQRLSR
jgi:hypothetical protein